MTNLWQDFTTAPRNSSVFVVKTKSGAIFDCHYAPVPNGMGWYGFLKLPELSVLQENDLMYWKKK